LDMLGGYYDVNARFPAPPQPGQPPNGPFSTRAVAETHLIGGAFLPAAYLELEGAPSARARLVPGLRVDYLNITRQLDVSPRVNARYDIVKEFPRTTLKGGVGLFHQAPQFNEITKPFGNPDLKSNRAVQYSLGVEQEMTK